MGDADWKAQNGEIIGTPKQPGGGWLVLDKSFQDVALFTNVTCTGGCKAGVLLRAEKTPDGMKGIYVSLTEGDLLSYAVTLDRQGKETGRTQLQSAAAGAAAVAAVLADAPVRARLVPLRAARLRRAHPGLRGRGRRAAAGGQPPVQPGATRGGGGGPPPPLPPGVTLPGLVRPTGAYLSGKTNSVDITLAKTAVTVRFNGGSLGAAGGTCE